MLFDRYLAAAKPRRQRRSLFVGVVLAHGLFAFALIIGASLHIEELTPPAVTITFVSAPPPPPPRSNSESSRSRPRHLERRARMVTVRQPIVTRQPEPPSDEQAGSDADASTDADGVAGGIVGGAPAPSPPPPPLPSAPRVVPSHVFDRDRLAAPDPLVPEPFRRRHARETIRGLYRICVRPDGHVAEVTPLQSIPGLDEMLIAHLKTKWLYKPQPSPVCTPRLFTFQID